MVLTLVSTPYSKSKTTGTMNILGDIIEYVLNFTFNTNGSILVEGTPTNTSFTIGLPNIGTTVNFELYEDVSANLVAQRFYFSSYNIWIYYDFNAVGKIKTRITGNVPNPIAFKMILSSSNQKSNVSNKLLFGIPNGAYPNEVSDYIGYDWQDVVNSGYVTSFNDNTNEITFNLPTSFDIDPSVIDSNSGSGIVDFYPHARNVIYKNGRYWVFYSDLTNLVHKTSTDSITWGSKITSVTGIRIYYSAIWWDTTKNKIARVRTTNFSDTARQVYFRFGTLESDGTITWDTEYDSRSTMTYEDGANYPNVCIDSDGYPVVMYGVYHNYAHYNMFIRRASSTLGSTWDAEFEIDSDNGMLGPLVLPLSTGRKLYSLWNNYTPAEGSRPLYGSYFDGSSWDASKTTITGDVYSYGWYTAVIDKNDKIHLAYTRGTTYPLCYRSWTYAGGWSSESTITTNSNSGSRPNLQISDANTLDVSCAWGYTGTIYYSALSNNTWSVETPVITDSTFSSGLINASYVLTSGTAFCIWNDYNNPTYYIVANTFPVTFPEAGTPSTYTIRFDARVR